MRSIQADCTVSCHVTNVQIKKLATLSNVQAFAIDSIGTAILQRGVDAAASVDICRGLDKVRSLCSEGIYLHVSTACLLNLLRNYAMHDAHIT